MELRFQINHHHEGLNLTVRRGIKSPGEREAYISLGEGDTQLVQLQTRVIPFSQLTDYDLAMEHDPECRTTLGLFQELKRLYGDFDMREIVTLVYYEVAL